MRVDELTVLDDTLRRAREEAFPPGEFVGQESFVSAGEIRLLARCAGVAPGVSVLDLCCGTAGPGLLIARECGCDYRGVDADPRAVAVARRRAIDEDVAARFDVARIPPLPTGPFDVVLLLETMLAFREKRILLREVSRALRVGGRFAFTVEEGRPLSPRERDMMPRSDTVWPISLPQLTSTMALAGLRVCWQRERTGAHADTVDALIEAYAAASEDIRALAGEAFVDDLNTAHRLWGHWLRNGRVRKFDIVAQKVLP
jgi:SAM-dependent methyltransferase